MTMPVATERSPSAREDLARTRELLEKAFGEKPQTGLERFHYRAALLVKYVGIPSLVLGAILPVYHLLDSITESINKDFLRTTYVRYVNRLLDEGKVDRAKGVMEYVKNLDKFDANTAMTSARLTALGTVQKGSSYEFATDTINVLIEMDGKRPVTFRKILTPEDRLSLRLILADVALENGRHQEAIAPLRELDKELAAAAAPSGYRDRVALRIGAFHTLEHDYPAARNVLEPLASKYANATARTDLEILGEANFQLGKVDQFAQSFDDAARRYTAAKSAFGVLKDDHRLLKTLNNMGNVYQFKGDMKTAFGLYSEELAVARRSDSPLAVARSSLNMGAVLRIQGKNDSALKLTLEANAIFKEQGNELGLATSSEALMAIYKTRLEYDKALAHGEEAFEYHTRVKDIRGLGNVTGNIGDVLRAMNLPAEAVFYNVAALAFQRHEGRQQKIPVIEGIIRSLRTALGEERFRSAARQAKDRIEALRLRLERDDIDFTKTVAILDEKAETATVEQ